MPDKTENLAKKEGKREQRRYNFWHSLPELHLALKLHVSGKIRGYSKKNVYIHSLLFAYLR